MNKPLLPTLFLAVLFCSFSAMAQPNNDDCVNATLLTVGTECVMQSFDSENQTAENPQPAPTPGCGFFQGVYVC